MNTKKASWTVSASSDLSINDPGLLIDGNYNFMGRNNTCDSEKVSVYPKVMLFFHTEEFLSGLVIITKPEHNCELHTTVSQVVSK